MSNHHDALLKGSSSDAGGAAYGTGGEGNANQGQAFVRHQFFRGHRAHPASPDVVKVQSTTTSHDLAARHHAYQSRHANRDLQKAPPPATGSAPVVNGSEASFPRQSMRASVRFSGYFFEEDAQERQRSLSAFKLLGLMFCNSIGGGYGLENSIQAGGSLITIIGVIILPLIWSLPVALVVAELASAIPTNGGFLMWINVSFPKTVYFFSVIVTLLLMFVDNAIYPALFADYSCQWMTCSKWEHLGLKGGVLLACALLNVVGIEAVGIATILITALSVTPFALMFVIHMCKTGYVNWENVGAYPSEIDWVALIPTLSWNVAGLEQAGSVAEDIADPQSTIMRAMIPLIGLVWLSYIPPIIAGVSLTRRREDWSVWDTGYWATVAGRIGGMGFKIFTVIGGVCSAFGLCLGCLCVTSRTIAGMGEAAAFPRVISRFIFTYNERFHTPHWAILINTLFTGVCVFFLDFSALVAIDQVLYGIRIILIFMAVIKLRYAFPTLHRPFRLPFTNDQLVLVLAVPMAYSIALIIISALVDLRTVITLIVVTVTAAVVSFVYCHFLRPHGFDGKIVRVEVEPLDGSAEGQPSKRQVSCYIEDVEGVAYGDGEGTHTTSDRRSRRSHGRSRDTLVSEEAPLSVSGEGSADREVDGSGLGARASRVRFSTAARHAPAEEPEEVASEPTESPLLTEAIAAPPPGMRLYDDD